jgi:hypothetical protein
VASFILCSQCCWSKHQNFFSILEWGPTRSGTSYIILGHIYIYTYIKKRKQDIDVFSTKLHDTLAYTAGKNKIIWFRPSVVETCPCTTVQHGATETVSTYLNAFVSPAVVGRVCQCNISAKYGCSVTTT